MSACHPPISVLTSAHTAASYSLLYQSTSGILASQGPKKLKKFPIAHGSGCLVCKSQGHGMEKGEKWDNVPFWRRSALRFDIFPTVRWRNMVSSWSGDSKAEDVMSIRSFSFLVIISAPRANISRARQGSWWTRTDSECINHTAGKNKGSNNNRAVRGLFTV